MPGSPTGLQSDLRLRRRPLRLRRRGEDIQTNPSASSLFARLSPSAVNRLCTDALCRAQTYFGGEEPSEQIGGWNISTQKDIHRVEFLPLSIKFSAERTIYVSYNGGEAGGGKEGDVLELPSFMIPEGYLDNAQIQVAALPSVRDADILNVEPLTVEDWELLETHADFLEEGALLRQVSVVYAGQQLPLWVGGRDIAWVKVLADNFGEQESVWPQSTSFGLEEECCLRLVAETRVCVAPKPKSGQKGDQNSPPLRVYPTVHDYSEPMIELAESLGNRQVCTTPGTAFLHPDTAQNIPAWNPDEKTGWVYLWNAERDPKNSIVMQIATCRDVPLNHIAIHHATRSRLDANPLVDDIKLRLLSPAEVARGATLFEDIGFAHNAMPSLETVTIHSTRTHQKWRYPYDAQHLEFPVSDMRPQPTNASSDFNALHANEPVEIGSFLNKPAEAASQCSNPIIYRLRDQREPAGEPSRSDDSSAQRYFAPLSDLLRLNSARSGKVCEVPDNETEGNDRLPRYTLEVHHTSHLQNLLPPFSILCSELEANLPKSICHDAIIYGDNGSGKTHTALVLAARARFLSFCSTFYLDCKALKEGRGNHMKEILGELHEIFNEARSCSGNALIILDDFSVLAPNFEETGGVDSSAQAHQVNPIAVDQSKLIADTTRLLMETVFSSGKLVSIIITSNEIQSLPASISTARPFMQPIKVPTLSAEERQLLLWRMLGSHKSDMRDNDPCAEYRAIRVGQKTEGFRPRDLQVLASRVRHSLQSSDETECSEAVKVRFTSLALADFTPMRLLSSKQSAESSTEWADIGGLRKVKEDLTNTILNPVKYRRIYEKAKIRLPRGVMVFGPPGCGKSFVIPALSKKCGFCLVTCRGPELLDRYIGASESKVRELFARAKASAPSILFFDEIDSLAPRRGSDKTGVTDRVVNQLLTLLDGVEDTASGGPVYIVAATSRPDIIDPALLRPGRLEKHIYVGYSETDEELTDLFLKMASRYSVDAELLERISSGKLVQELGEASPHVHRFSAADVKAAFDTAQLSAIHEVLQLDRANAVVCIGYRHLITSLKQTRPSLPQRDYAMMMEAYRPFRKDILEQSGDGDSASGTKIQKLRGAHKDLRTALR